MSRDEAGERGWRELDVILITGDAYVDHPSFAPALLGRMLEAKGFRVGIIARPRPDQPDNVAVLGRPRLFFAVAPGAVDSMLNNMTAQKRKRRTDAYAPGGEGGGRPNRAAIVYCNMVRRVFGKDAAVLLGGVEASLRRFAHYDFWDDAVRRPILLDAPADALVHGMGEKPLMEIAVGMRSHLDREDARPADALRSIARDVRGVCYTTAASSDPPSGYRALADVESVRDDPHAQVKAFRDEMQHRLKGTFQDCAGHRAVANPPPDPLTAEELDALYELPFARRAHPSYAERVPALDQVQFSVTSHRGCCGGCAFCGITTHQGKTVQSRSQASILREVETLTAHPDFRGTIRDIGGATANMWGARCTAHRECRKASCLAPEICEHLHVDQNRYLALLKAAGAMKGVKHLFISSGVRMDLALQCEPFVEAFAQHYTSGHAKVAPEHAAAHVLRLMMKPDGRLFLDFVRRFREASSRAGKEQYVLPYFIAAHPGSRIEDMIEVALLLKRERMRVEQCQIFTPIPGTASAVMYATGINPFDGKPVFVEKDLRRREMQKALVLYHLRESAGRVREALELCGRADLVPELLSVRRAPRGRRVAKRETTGGCRDR